MASVQFQEWQQETTTSIATEYRCHDAYDVKNEDGESIGIGLLCLYYGELWESALDRLIHKIDGHMFTITYEGLCYNVYRKVDEKQLSARPHLKLV